MDLFRGVAELVPWNAIGAASSILTALIAWFVFLEARSIKRLQWLSQAADKWQDFNQLLVESAQSERWEAIRSGTQLHQPLNATDKRLMLMYFNIQMIEYHLVRKGIIPASALKAMQKELAGFRPHGAFVNFVLEEGGYDPEYVNFVGRCLAGQKE